jgi:hypothetical protein
VDFNSANVTRIIVDFVLDIEPTDATKAYVWIGDAWHECTWIGATTTQGRKYMRTGRTIRYFRGPRAETGPAGSYLLGRRQYPTKIKVKQGDDEVVAASETIDVV